MQLNDLNGLKKKTKLCLSLKIAFFYKHCCHIKCTHRLFRAHFVFFSIILRISQSPDAKMQFSILNIFFPYFPFINQTLTRPYLFLGFWTEDKAAAFERRVREDESFCTAVEKQTTVYCCFQGEG